MSKLLRDRVALVTGSTSNIGLATARELASHGAHVIVHGRSVERARPIAESLGCDLVTGDMGVIADIDAMFDAITDRHGRLDVLVNSAAISSRTHLLDLTIDEWNQSVAINATGVLRAMQLAAALMPQGGSIVNISTSLVPQPGIGRGAYAGSKAAMDALTRQAAIDLAPQNIRVNAVVSGQVGSPVGQRDLGHREATSPGIPLGRIGEPEEVARAVRFLASADASYITNTFLTVDGGRMNAARVADFGAAR